MNITEIKKLLEMFDASNSVKLKITNENFEISLEKTAAKIGKIAPIQPPQIAESVLDSAPKATKSPKIAESTAESNIDSTNSANTETINSPMVGTFYRAPSPDSAPYVNVGDKVKKGQTIAIIEAMKIMNEIEAEFDCKIVEIVPNDAQSVEFDAVLFVVEKI
ncbi:acetyl-CoA carboxylase biotin carboxyl carrier protein [Helicobacter sp. 23-1045]